MMRTHITYRHARQRRAVRHRHEGFLPMLSGLLQLAEELLRIARYCKRVHNRRFLRYIHQPKIRKTRIHTLVVATKYLTYYHEDGIELIANRPRAPLSRKSQDDTIARPYVDQRITFIEWVEFRKCLFDLLGVARYIGCPAKHHNPKNQNNHARDIDDRHLYTRFIESLLDDCNRIF